MDRETLRRFLTDKDACKPAKDWVSDRDLKTAWRDCPRASWLAWFLEEARVSVAVEVKVVAACAKYITDSKLDETSRLYSSSWVNSYDHVCKFIDKAKSERYDYVLQDAIAWATLAVQERCGVEFTEATSKLADVVRATVSLDEVVAALSRETRS